VIEEGVIRVATPEEMRELGRLLGEELRPGDTICLRGDLGAGKTTLTQGIAAGMGTSGTVASPTFTLVHEHPGKVPLFHMDAYRLDSSEELWDLGFDDYLRAGGVVVIEWGERVSEALPDERLTLMLAHAGDARLVSIQAHGERARELESVLRTKWGAREIA
jgi:tRNA threonylcarbamoyladenosine biosynthesis protein TsaE